MEATRPTPVESSMRPSCPAVARGRKLWLLLERISLIAYLVAVVMLCLYVPWVVSGRQFHFQPGYSWLWDPPHFDPDLGAVIVDTTRVLLTLAAATAILVACLVVTRTFGPRRREMR